MGLERCSGVLLHPTSLPGKYGVGTFGSEAYEWVDFLSRNQQTIWQILPLGPTSYGDSPYQSSSTFAGNPYLISLDDMVSDGLMDRQLLIEAISSPEFNANFDEVDFGSLYKWKLPLLNKAAAQFDDKGNSDLAKEYKKFCKDNKNWLDDYALFSALKKKFSDKAWSEWPDEFKFRKDKAMREARQELASEIKGYCFIQWVFDRQWSKLRTYANKKGIKIIGDLPIFVAMDSSDAWTNTALFCFDKNLVPTAVAGVPPDGFAADGQLWGNPLYNWEKMKKTGYSWWIERLKAALKRQDYVRIDHFRGFAAYWSVPFGEKTAKNGKWLKGPGADFFKAIQKALGKDLPIIAEDLGVITEDVVALRDGFAFPGMKILQFAFGGGAQGEYLPHNYTANCITYTGTHDNNTSRGWYENDASEKEKDYLRRYFSTDGWDVAWTMIRGIFASVAKVAIVPAQDLLSLGKEARMNYPGKARGNWSWRFRREMFTPHIEWRLKEITETYGREREKEVVAQDEAYQKAAEAARKAK